MEQLELELPTWDTSVTGSSFIYYATIPALAQFFITKGDPLCLLAVVGLPLRGHVLTVCLSSSSKGLASSSTFTLEEGTIYLSAEPDAVELPEDSASVLDVYLVSTWGSTSSPSLLVYKWAQAWLTRKKSEMCLVLRKRIGTL